MYGGEEDILFDARLKTSSGLTLHRPWRLSMTRDWPSSKNVVSGMVCVCELGEGTT